MKKFLLIFSIIFVSFLAQNVSASEERVENYKVEIDIYENALIKVTEIIDYNFGDNNKHGIYRDIPFRFQDNFFSYNMRIDDISVVDDNGNSYNFVVSGIGNNKRIKIGEEDKFVRGRKTYIISYTVDRSIKWREDTDEFYWNIIGNFWEVPILKTQASIFFHEALVQDDLWEECYQGDFASEDECEFVAYIGASGQKINQINYKTGRLESGQGQTVLIKFPKGFLLEPSDMSKLAQWLADNWILFLPFLAFLILFYIWDKYGKDPEGKGNIIVQFDVPDNLTPAEVGVIVSEKTSNKDISAEIINLAINGYLRIIYVDKKGFFGKKDFLLERLKKSDDDLVDHQTYLLAKLFATPTKLEKLKGREIKEDVVASILMSELKDSFYVRVKKIHDKVFKKVIRKKYFVNDPQKIRSVAMILLVVSAILIPISFTYLFYATGLAGMIAVFATLLFIVFFVWQMPKKTKKGALAREYILGFKEYLRVAEKDRLEFHNAPAKKPATFEKFLPFAMILGVEKEWAKQFEDIYLQSPDWYQGASMASFSSSNFINDIASFNSKTSSSVARPSSSGGGGSTGGGGGGGGGGSW